MKNKKMKKEYDINKRPAAAFIDPELESRKFLPSEAPKIEEEMINITQKDVDGEFKIEIDNSVNTYQPPRKFVQTSLRLRNRVKYMFVVLVIIATVIAGAMILYDTLLNNQSYGSGSGEFKEKNIAVAFSDSQMSVRCDWSSSESIAYLAKINSSSSLGFELEKVVLCSRDDQRNEIPKNIDMIADLSKSVSLMSLRAPNPETIGINNGWDGAVRLYSKAHNLKLTDIGSVFSDSSKRKFTIVRIPDANNIIVHPSSADYSNASYKFALPSSKSLDFVSGKSTIKKLNFSGAERAELYPFFNNSTLEITADSNSVDISKPGSILCADFSVKSSFDVLNVVPTLKYLETNAGKNNNETFHSDALTDKLMRVSYSYTFSQNGSCSVKTEIESKTDVRFLSVSGMSIPMPKLNNCGYVYIPNASDYNAFGVPVRNNDDLIPDKWSDKNIAPYRFFAFSNAELTKGVCMGFRPDDPESESTRKDTLGSAARLDFDNGLIMPYVISKDTVVNKGGKLEFVNFIVPFEKKTNDSSDSDLNSVCWYWVNDDIYLMIDAHKAVSKDIILPSYMDDMKLTPVDLSESANVDAGKVNEGIVDIEITSKYGYAVLKLTQ